ncbi:MAG: sporulation protein [Patescibacteria group bacterium]|nr:sporulation protein [Patescibacteria group bacterium]
MNSNEFLHASFAEARRAYRLQNVFNAIFCLLFLGLVVLATVFIPHIEISLLSLSAFQVAVLVLSVFRLTRLTVSDAIMQWLRDCFMNVTSANENGAFVMKTELPKSGFKREVSVLLSCPWCTSMWWSLISIIIWIAVPASHFVFYILALSGAATLLYLFAVLMIKGTDKLKQ